MSTLLHYLQMQANNAKAEAEAILAKSDEEGRELTKDEAAEISAHMDTFKMYSARSKAEQDKIAVRQALEAETGVADQVAPVVIEGDPGLPATIGEAFIASGAFKAIQLQAKSNTLPRDWKTAGVDVPRELLLKAAASPVLESNNATLFGAGTATGRLTTLLGMETPGFVVIPPVIADLIPSIQVTTGNSVSYPTVKNRTPAAYPGNQPIAEGAAKFAALYEFDVVDKKLIKLACYTKFSTEFIEDAPGIAAYINADLPAQIRAAEDTYLATVLDAAAANATTLQTGGRWDALMGAITDVRTAGGSPDGIVITPADWAGVVTEVPTSGDGHYIGGGGPGGSATLSAWGVRVVVSNSAPSGHPIVGDFARGAKVYRKGSLMVDATNTDQDDFIKNLMTVRAEERLVLGVTYPEWFKNADVT